MISDPVHPTLFIAHHNGLREADLARLLLGEAYRRKAPASDLRAQSTVAPSAGRRDAVRLRTA
jgi:hypothetical protein